VPKVKVVDQTFLHARDQLTSLKWPTNLRDKAMRDALAGEMLSACVCALKSYGLRRARLMDLARDAVMNGRPKSKTARVVLEATRQLAEMIAKWGEDPAYLDRYGRPAVLRVSGGARDFALLVGKFFPDCEPTDVLDFGCEIKALEKVGKDKVARLNDYVVFTGNSLLILAYSVRAVRRYLSTANFNRQRGIAVVESRADRTSESEISDKDMAEFMRVMRPQISDLVEMSNRWLAHRAELTRNVRSRKKVAGLQAFLFCE
jgi:hypothetical protein